MGDDFDHDIIKIKNIENLEFLIKNSSSILDNRTTKLIKENQGYTFNVDSSSNDSLKNLDDLFDTLKEAVFTHADLSLHMSDIDVYEMAKIIKVRVRQFSTINFSYDQPYLYTLIIPTKNKIILDFHFEERISLTLKIDNIEFIISQRQRDGISLLIIKCKQELTHKEFERYTFSILIGFGFITGSFIQNEAYFIAYDEFQKLQHICFRELRPSLKSN